MVDEIQVWPHAKHPFKAGSCHLTADSLEELHAFAAKLGMKRGWFQQHAVADHYDLTPSRREKALKLGAVFVPAKTQALQRRAKRQIAAPLFLPPED